MSYKANERQFVLVIDDAPDIQDLVARRQRAFGAHALLSYANPVEFVRGEGVWLFDHRGTPYLDVYNNVPSVGHCHPHVVEAISRQAAALNTNTRYLNEVVCSYAEKLLASFPPELSNIVLTCTGSEGVDLAIRVARNVTGAAGFIVTRYVVPWEYMRCSRDLAVLRTGGSAGYPCSSGSPP